MTRLGVVVPTLNEAVRLPLLLEDLARLPVPAEVVVSDGGSEDGTVAAARRRGARVVRGARGRAGQLNRGAADTRAPWLLFLHADARLGPEARRALAAWLARAGPEDAAVFRFALEGGDRYWRFIEFGQRLRQRLSGLPYGDQGLVVSRRLFDAVGGYPELPVMEDVEMVRRLRRRGRLETLPAALVTSPRRYRREGKLRGWLRNTALASLYLAGVRPERLARWYRPHPRTRPVLLVFAKAPAPGRVKTRLAAEIGEEAASRIYREMGRRVVEGVAAGAYDVVVCYDPPDAEAEVRSWLGPPDGVRFRPQARGDLGARLRAAFREAFDDGAGPVCAIGTDAPDVDPGLVTRAFRALRSDDVVVGPAEDGGYYLIGLARPEPELFRSVPWSTSRVLEATRARARERSLSLGELEALSDVDTAADLAGRG